MQICFNVLLNVGKETKLKKIIIYICLCSRFGPWPPWGSCWILDDGAHSSPHYCRLCPLLHFGLLHLSESRCSVTCFSDFCSKWIILNQSFHRTGRLSSYHIYIYHILAKRKKLICDDAVIIFPGEESQVLQESPDPGGRTRRHQVIWELYWVYVMYIRCDSASLCLCSCFNVSQSQIFSCDSTRGEHNASNQQMSNCLSGWRCVFHSSCVPAKRMDERTNRLRPDGTSTLTLLEQKPNGVKCFQIQKVQIQVQGCRFLLFVVLWLKQRLTQAGAGFCFIL